jgi:hypothetical protein
MVKVDVKAGVFVVEVGVDVVFLGVGVVIVENV